MNRIRDHIRRHARRPDATDLDERLPAGQYTVMAEILVNGNATNSEIERIPVVIGRKP